MGRQILLFLIFGLCILGPCAVMAATAFASISALGRNPSAAPKIFTAMTLTLILAEALAIVAMIIVYMLFQGG